MLIPLSVECVMCRRMVLLRVWMPGLVCLERTAGGKVNASAAGHPLLLGEGAHGDAGGGPG